MVLTESGERLDIGAIDSAASELGVTLPSDYVEFMLESNGGLPEEDFVFDYFDRARAKEARSLVQEFFVIYRDEDGQADSLKSVSTTLWAEHAIAKSMLPFAEDLAGNYLCMSLSAEDYGTVYFCDHEHEDAGTEYMVSSRVSGSFSGFIESLYVDEE